MIFSLIGCKAKVIYFPLPGFAILRIFYAYVRLLSIILPAMILCAIWDKNQILSINVSEAAQSCSATISDIAKRLFVSESTISRKVACLAELRALDLVQKGKTKEMRITLTGTLLR